VRHYRELSGDNKAGVHHVGRNDGDDDDNHDYDNNQADVPCPRPGVIGLIHTAAERTELNRAERVTIHIASRADPN